MPPSPWADREVVAFHLAFAGAAVLGLFLPGPAPSGWRMAGLVALYLMALPAWAWWRGHREWLDLFAFLLPVSVLQVLPDWFLSRVLGVLVFPADGFPKIGTVSAYMAGLWTIPLFLTVWAGLVAARARGPGVGAAVAALAALVIFWASEETLWAVPVWHAQHVTMVGHAAVYVLVPEAILGAVTFDTYRRVQRRPPGIKLLHAVPVTLTYTGALAIAYLFVEGLRS